MELQYYLPRAELRDYVRAYYYFSAGEDSSHPICAELGNIRILLEGAGHLVMPGAKEPTEVPSTFLIGPTMGAYSMHVRGGTRVFGMGIRPRGWVQCFSINAYEAADRVFDLTEVARRVAGSAIEAVHDAKTPQEMAEKCDEYFVDLLARRANKAIFYPQAIEDWLLNDQELQLDHLIEMMDVSRRQTDRLAKRFFGASPKMLQRKYRALRAADRIRKGEPPWQFAAGAGFYDQSHFIKEFKTFVGVTPAQFFNRETALVREIQEKRRTPMLQLPLASV